MTTIKDIAKMAGVSHGTVSNVLNGRGNVSTKKMKLVEQAAQKLGYQLNAQAKVLREGQPNTVSIILPNIISEHYAHLYAGLNQYYTRHDYDIALYLTADQLALEQQFIQRIAAKRDHAVIVVSSLNDAESYYQALKIDPSRIVFVYRKPKNAIAFISLDFELAGKEIAEQIMSKQYRRLGLFSNYDKHTHSSSLKQGLLTQFAAKNYLVELKHIESASLNNTYSLAFDFFSQHQAPVEAIITSDIERAHYVLNASYLGSLDAPPTIYSLANNSAIYPAQIQQYQMNYGSLSDQIIDLLEHKVSPRQIKNSGFLFQSMSPASVTEQPATKITLLTLPSPSTQALLKLLPHFKKISHIDVEIVIKPFNEIPPILEQLKQHQHIDMIRIDIAGLPWFAQRCLKPLNALDFDLKPYLSHYPAEIVERFSYVQDVAYAIPFDPSIQMLFYRQDLFNNPWLKRVYFETYKQHLEVPTSFEAYQQVCGFFNRKINPDSPVDFGGCITLGNTELLASEFLVRYYAQGGQLTHGDKVELNPAIALQTLALLKEYLSVADKISASWWDESIIRFEQGQLAMLIVYMNLFYYITNKNIAPLLGYTTVPDLHPLIGGGSIGISKYSDKNQAVATFFNWLFSDEISEQIALLGGANIRDNIFQNKKIMTSYPWFELSEKEYAIGRRENTLPRSGLSINLRLIENIIGQHIQDWIIQDTDSRQTIDNINQALQQKAADILSS
ncbi:extracellular solute-binding protein [Utexia brackfieldae]|uniref:extracellular solute-binding protein n=1 Tax=Utexia brackfieldae TaxID=3074108 RepID=UPI00370D88E6